MNYNTLISATDLHAQLNNPDWLIVDCRFQLQQTEVGAYAYRHGHIPNAVYMHLEHDLSSPVKAGTGRHPLPDYRVLSQKLGALGVNVNTQVVAYDDAGGLFAARLWWLLRYLGHERVAVLNGGLRAWLQQGLTLTTQLPTPKAACIFRPYLNPQPLISATELQNRIAQKKICLIDARAAERYAGHNEPIDPVAGHIPYAHNRPTSCNLDRNGLFLPTNQLKAEFSYLLGAVNPEQTVHYCGSGVTACHNVLAMEYAGLRNSQLYAGSWSEWITDKNRQIVVNRTIINSYA